MLYDTIIPIGANCRLAQALRDLNLRTKALPIDWTLSSSQAVLKLFENDFEGFFSRANCKEMSFISKSGKFCPWVFNHEYQISFIHDKDWSETRLLTYNTRISALKEALNQEKVLLIRWDMKAPFHNDHNHREHEKRDVEYFGQQDSLESIYQIKDLCNEKYNSTIDLLILHADEIEESSKRADVLYHQIDANKAKKEAKYGSSLQLKKHGIIMPLEKH
jgi:hypothetical protein